MSWRTVLPNPQQKRRGPFQSEPVLRAFSIYFTAYGIQTEIPSDDPGIGVRPIGALALAATAVRRSFHRYRVLTHFRWNEHIACT